MESCGATVRVKAAKMKPLRHAMESESMASSARTVEGAIPRITKEVNKVGDITLNGF